MVRARAVVGFYRGDLVVPGQIVELSDGEFFELLACGKVERVPAIPVAREPEPVRQKLNSQPK